MSRYQIKVIENNDISKDFKYLDIILEGEENELTEKLTDRNFAISIGVEPEDIDKRYKLIKI